MMGQKTAVLVRCCDADREEAVSLFELLATITPDVYVVYAGEAQAEAVLPSAPDRVISLDPSFLRRADLETQRLDFASYAWQCGDLALYAAYDHVKADYYWMIEPDVYASPEVLQRLLSAPLKADFYAPKVRREYERWHWHAGTRNYFDEVLACLFCVLAIRTSVIPALRDKRRQIVAHWASTAGAPRQMPNDEGFVCSFLHATGRHCADLNELFRVYTKRSIGFGMPGSRRSLALSRSARKLVHHPVCTGPAFEHKVRQRVTTMGLWYRTAHDILVERDVLPIAPVVDQLTTGAYLFLVQPGAAWRRATLKLGGIKGVPQKFRRVVARRARQPAPRTVMTE